MFLPNLLLPLPEDISKAFRNGGVRDIQQKLLAETSLFPPIWQVQLPASRARLVSEYLLQEPGVQVPNRAKWRTTSPISWFPGPRQPQRGRSRAGTLTQFWGSKPRGHLKPGKTRLGRWAPWPAAKERPKGAPPSPPAKVGAQVTRGKQEPNSSSVRHKREIEG